MFSLNHCSSLDVDINTVPTHIVTIALTEWRWVMSSLMQLLLRGIAFAIRLLLNQDVVQSSISKLYYRLYCRVKHLKFATIWIVLTNNKPLRNRKPIWSTLKKQPSRVSCFMWCLEAGKCEIDDAIIISQCAKWWCIQDTAISVKAYTENT